MSGAEDKVDHGPIVSSKFDTKVSLPQFCFHTDFLAPYNIHILYRISGYCFKTHLSNVASH